MTTKTTETETTKKKTFNPTIAVLFVDDRFGKGALVSAPVDEEKYTAIMKNVQVGSKLVLKQTMSKSGKPVAFLEVLPLLNTKNYAKRAAKGGDTDI